MSDGADDSGPDDDPDDGPPEGAAADGAAPDGAPRKRRRRRRRRQPDGDAPADAPQAQAAAPQAAQPQQPAQPQPQPPQSQPRNERREGRDDRPRGQRNEPRERRPRDDRPRDDRPREPRPAPPAPAPASIASDVARGSDPHLAYPAPADDDDAPDTAQPREAWGTDDGAPAPAIQLAADLPADAPADDPDPVTFPLADSPSAQLGDDILSVVAARFVPAGRISWFEAGDADYQPGDRVVVDAERGTRLAWIATAPARKASANRSLRRVVRRANEADLRGERDDAGRAHALRIAKDKAAALRLPLKVFRVEAAGGKLIVYYTSDDRLDLRDFVRDVAQATGLRPELRQLGVRDEAKAVGGIGTCGLTLCCTTWLPEFVPVSIKMAKDQGLVLSPTKVSGQCGRLKCCLVYEQAAYAELRKGLPKLGKRVIGARGEGRVVEVDVLRQRVRVSYGPGDTEVVPATVVRPMFPPGGQQARPSAPELHDSDDETSDDDDTDSAT